MINLHDYIKYLIPVFLQATFTKFIVASDVLKLNASFLKSID